MTADSEMVRKISGLLKKAEGTDSEHEAAAFFAKANELMLKYAIDEARVRDEKRAHAGARVEEPTQEYWMYATHDAHAKAKVRLVEVVARSQHVRFSNLSNRPGSNTYREGNSGRYSQWGSLVGYQQDIDNVKLLLTSLMIQWTRFARQDVSFTGRTDYGYRTGHLMGFSERVGERLIDQEREVLTAANANALMVNKDAEIRSWLDAKRKPSGWENVCLDYSRSKNRFCALAKGHGDKHFHTIKPARREAPSREVDYSGYGAGSAAGSRADLGTPRDKIKG